MEGVSCCGGSVMMWRECHDVEGNMWRECHVEGSVMMWRGSVMMWRECHDGEGVS